MIQSTALIGLGAMGLLFADQIQTAKGDTALTVVLDEERLSRYAARSFSIHERPVSFHYRTPAQAEDPVDLAIFAVKYGGLASAIESMRPFIGPQTTILSLLNGIQSEEDLSDAFHKEQVLLCVAQGMDATFAEDRLLYSRPGLLEIGVQEQEQAPRLAALQEFLESCGIVVVLPEDIRHNLWSKLMLNVGVNQVVGLAGGGYGVIQKPGPERDTMIAAMREVISVAAPEGIFLREEDLNAYLRVLDGFSPQAKPSLLQDIEAGRKTELELFSGSIRAFGQKHGIPTPINDELYARLRAIEGRSQV